MKGKEFVICFGEGPFKIKGPNVVTLTPGIYPVIGFTTIEGIEYPIICVSSQKESIYVGRNFLYGGQVPFLLDLLKKMTP